jgi:hypothetical protein
MTHSTTLSVFHDDVFTDAVSPRPRNAMRHRTSTFDSTC